MEIENIEAVRLREGIDDVGLRDRICSLTTEDRVRVSISGDGKLFEKVSVRITSRKGERFRGKLISRPRQASLQTLGIGSTMRFDGGQIHSIIAGKKAADQPLAVCFVVHPETHPEADDADALNSARISARAPTRVSAVPSADPRFSRSTRPPTPKKTRKPAKGRLRVQLDGTRRFIQVPTGIANELHQYLRNSRVRSAPPQPYLCDSDCIELDRSIDVAAVQSVLDAWRRGP